MGERQYQRAGDKVHRWIDGKRSLGVGLGDAEHGQNQESRHGTHKANRRADMQGKQGLAGEGAQDHQLPLGVVEAGWGGGTLGEMPPRAVLACADDLVAAHRHEAAAQRGRCDVSPPEPARHRMAEERNGRLVLGPAARGWAFKLGAKENAYRILWATSSKCLVS